MTVPAPSARPPAPAPISPHLTRARRLSSSVFVAVNSARLIRYRIPVQQHGTHHHRVPGARIPVFVDEHGTPCAMAYLIAFRYPDATLYQQRLFALTAAGLIDPWSGRRWRSASSAPWWPPPGVAAPSAAFRSSRN